MEDTDILQDFIEEAREHLEGIESDLLTIEEAGSHIDSELVNKVFRAIHSVKGGAGFLGLTNIKELSHIQENILNQIRNKQRVPTPTIMTPLLNSIDVLKDMVENFETSNDRDIRDQLELLKAIENDSEDPPEPPKLDRAEELKKAGHTLYEIEWHPKEDFASDEAKGSLFSNLEKTGEILFSEVPVEQVKTSSVDTPFKMIYATILESTFIDTLIPLPPERLKPTDAIISLKETPQASEAKSSQKKSSSSSGEEGSLRVPLKTLNTLMIQAGELVLSRNQLVEAVKSGDPAKVQTASQKIDVVTSDLQLSIMGTRMQPIGKVFSRFSRVVRDLASQLNKKVRLEIEGKEVELDKTIIESISDPLTHLVRNAVDHGIEPPDVRLKAKKPETGLLQLRAYHEAGHVFLEIVDDGKGIDLEKVKAKALESGNFEPSSVEMMSEKELLHLIFHPGFSLAKKVTEVSGRGVGMDVVHTNFTKLGGVVDIESTLGKGCVVRIKLPLTLAIIPSLVVRVGAEYFAIPQVNLVELVRIPPAAVKNRIQMVGQSPVLRLRDSILPLLKLSEVLGCPDVYLDKETNQTRDDRRQNICDRRSDVRGEASTKDRRRFAHSSTNIAVVTVDNFRYGLIIDEFLDSEEIVVKPLGHALKECQEYAGATIRGDGRVALILDILGISKKMNLSAISDTNKQAQAIDLADLDELQSFLIVANEPGEQFAVPLGLVSRIERIDKEQMETITGRTNVKYEDRSLPIVTLQQINEVAPLPEADSYFVLAFNIHGHEVGLLVANLIDAVQTQAKLDATTYRQPGILGSGVINNHTTLLVDLFQLTKMFYPEWVSELNLSSNADTPLRVLVVDDSKFYRTQISDFVNEIGCYTETAEDGVEGFQKLMHADPPFDVLLTDIEMPNLDGLGLTRKIRQDEKLQELPVIAITSLAGEKNQQEAIEAGVNQYMVKLNKDEIIRALGQFTPKKG